MMNTKTNPVTSSLMEIMKNIRRLLFQLKIQKRKIQINKIWKKKLIKVSVYNYAVAMDVNTSQRYYLN